MLIYSSQAAQAKEYLKLNSKVGVSDIVDFIVTEGMFETAVA